MVQGFLAVRGDRYPSSPLRRFMGEQGRAKVNFSVSRSSGGLRGRQQRLPATIDPRMVNLFAPGQSKALYDA